MRRSPALANAHAQLSQQRRAMGFFSDIKNQFKNELEKNEELKKSLEELQKTKEQLKEVEKAAKEKYQEVSSKTEEAAKNLQDQAASASQKLKETIEENVKPAGAAAAASEASDEKHDGEKHDGEKEADPASENAEEVRFVAHVWLGAQE